MDSMVPSALLPLVVHRCIGPTPYPPSNAEKSNTDPVSGSLYVVAAGQKAPVGYKRWRTDAILRGSIWV